MLWLGFTFGYRIGKIKQLSSLNNPILQLKGGVRTEQEKHLEQTEDKLFDLAGEIIVLVQTMPHSTKEWTLAALQEREEQLMSKAEKPWKRIAKV